MSPEDVIDAGLHRERRYDPLLREARLETVSGGASYIRGTDVTETLAYYSYTPY
jgi:hypothetical protein